MDALWPDLDLPASGANLRKALHYARSALEDVAPGASAMVTSEGDVVALAPDASVDAEEFRAALAAARRAGDPDQYRRAVDQYHGELLPDDLYDEWAEAPRRELHVEFLAGLTELVGMLEASGDLDEASAVARRLVSSEPTREEGQASLIRLYALAGRRSDALRQYELLVQLLDVELGMEPSPDTQRLYEEIRARQADEPELSSELWERVGDLRVLAGDAVGAAKAFGQALDARAAREATARIERKCGEAWLMQHRPDVAAAHLSTAEAIVIEPAERARLLRAQANQAWESGQIEQAQQFAELALDGARQHGTADDVAAAHEALAIVAHFKGQWRDGLASELERLTTDESSGALLSRVIEIHHCIGQYHLYGDGLSESVEGYARKMLDQAEAAGAVRAQSFAWCLLGETLLLQARWDEADGCLARSCELHATLGSRSGALPWQRRAELAACLGAHDEVVACLRQASGIATVSTMARHVWGRIHATAAFSAVSQGDPGRAVQSIQAAAAAAARYGDCPTCSALLNPVAAEAFAQIGDTEAARGYADAAAAVAGMFESSAWRAMADSAAGSASLAAGDGTGAAGEFESARALYERARQPYWAERSARLATLVPA
jgi:DNA-binding SARP family transcriptional activator